MRDKKYASSFPKKKYAFSFLIILFVVTWLMEVKKLNLGTQMLRFSKWKPNYHNFKNLGPIMQIYKIEIVIWLLQGILPNESLSQFSFFLLYCVGGGTHFMQKLSRQQVHSPQIPPFTSTNHRPYVTLTESSSACQRHFHQ